MSSRGFLRIPLGWEFSLHRDVTRHPHGLPRWGYAVRLVVHVRRVRCLHAGCMADTFADLLPQVVRAAVQRPARLTTALQHLGLTRSGEAGSRLGATFHRPTSPDSVWRLIGPCPVLMIATPGILEVDDGAVRRGYADGMLRPEEGVQVPCIICLLERQPFQFEVAALGLTE